MKTTAQPLRCLIVEDSEDDALLVLRKLRTGGYDVTSERVNTPEAMRAALERAPWDIVISDYSMPHFSGPAALELLQASGHDLPFIIVSGTIGEDTAGEAMRLGATDYLIKGKLTRLRPVVERELASAAQRRERQQVDLQLRASQERYVALVEGVTDSITARKQVEEKLRESNKELRKRKWELGERVKELTLLHELNNFTSDSEDVLQILRSVVNELPAAFQFPDVTFARIRLADEAFTSDRFRETKHRLRESLTVDHGRSKQEIVIEVFVDPVAIDDAAIFLEEEALLLKSTGNILSLEIQRRETLRQLELENRISNELLHLVSSTIDKSEAEIIQNFLISVVMLTDSEIGYLHFVNEDQETIQLVGWLEATTKAYTAVNESFYPISKAGIWANCFRTRTPIVHNDYPKAENKKGLPEGHAPLARHLSVPVFEGEQITMILGVGNRPLPYVQQEMNATRRIATSLWRIVDRRRHEMNLHAANDRLTLLQTALEADVHTVVITDVKGRIQWVNPAFTRNTGYEAAEVIGQNPRVIKSGKQDDGFYQNLWQTISAGKVWTGEFVNKRKDGTFFDEDVSITPVKNSTGEITHFIAIKQDVTEKHELEERYLRSQRMESIGLLAGGVAHDLNNVLSPIMMAVEMLRQHLPEADKMEIINTMATSCERGAGIIRQVLTFARGVEGERVLLQIRHLAKDMIKIARETFPKNITLGLDMPSDLWTIVGDATQLHQIYLNLCINARDALSTGGEIIITGKNATLNEPRHSFDQKIPAGRYVHVCVSDNGSGMSKETITHIFEPFFTTKEQSKGTGLGLSTVYGIVKSHKGLIEVDSTPGKGTEFHLYLPAANDATDDTAKPQATLPSGKGETILLVDDEPGVLTVTGKILTQFGYQVITATDGAQAVARYAENRDTIALVLTDIMMPIMDGVALTRALLTINPHIKIVGSSGYVGKGGSGNQMESLKKLGVKTMLAKPYTSQDLLTTLADELQD